MHEGKIKKIREIPTIRGDQKLSRNQYPSNCAKNNEQ